MFSITMTIWNVTVNLRHVEFTGNQSDNSLNEWISNQTRSFIYFFYVS